MVVRRMRKLKYWGNIGELSDIRGLFEICDYKFNVVFVCIVRCFFLEIISSLDGGIK